jgi:hypothetical protein
MRVDTNSELSRATRIHAPTPPPKARNAPSEVNLPTTDALDAALKATPDVGTEQVARARALIREPGYPSDRVVDHVAEVLARSIRSNE